MYPSRKALVELQRLNQISQNKNPTDWEKQEKQVMKISSLNCRSLKKHFKDIASDASLLKSDIICLNETWLEEDEITEELKITKYDLHLNSKGKGKGIAIYYKSGIFEHDFDIKEDDMQLSKFVANDLEVIAVYRSQRANYRNLNQNLAEIITEGKLTLIIGDFNFCYQNSPCNTTKKYLENQNFCQLIREPTHIEGHVLDQAYINRNVEAIAVTQSKYYTDHKGLAILLRKGKV